VADLKRREGGVSCHFKDSYHLIELLGLLMLFWEERWMANLFHNLGKDVLVLFFSFLDILLGFLV
jgi:hypothetical protein